VAESAPTPLLAPGLLAGRVVVVAGPPGRAGLTAARTCAVLGGRVVLTAPGRGAHGSAAGELARAVVADPGDEAELERALGGIRAREGALHVLVNDATEATGGRGPMEAFAAGADRAWLATRAAARAAMIPTPERGEPAGGLIVNLAPRPGAGAGAAVVRAALENMARTLSIEWARFGIRPVTILPGPHATDEDVATLVAYLTCPAGAYYSGCVLTVGMLPAPGAEAQAGA
jgi:NAD(P)-dependent dehydrogenase (short-subunit alcohol dehydrogenase family)